MGRTARDDFNDDDDDDDRDADDDARRRDEPELSDRDEPDELDLDDPGDAYAETVPCPYCGKPVDEQAELCAHCNSFISFEDAPRRMPWWFWAGVILCLGAVLVWIL